MSHCRFRQSLFSIALWALAMATALGAPPPPREQAGEILVRYRSIDCAPALVAASGGESESAPQGLRSVAPERAGAGRPESLVLKDAHFGLLAARPLEGAAPGVRSASQSRAAMLWLLRFDAAQNPTDVAASYRADPNVLYAEPNYLGSLFYTPSDPHFEMSQSDFEDIGVPLAWDLRPGADADVAVAIIDSGVDRNHVDLRASLDLARSRNFPDGNAEVYDDIGHGTRVAGIVGAVANNGEGTAGIAFGCTLLSLDVANGNGIVAIADVVAALNWAVASGADIVNMSLGFSVASRALEEACEAAQNAGVLLVAAAGNANRGDSPVYPASYPTVIGVGAVQDKTGARAPWSNYNGLDETLVELVAPGATVFSTIPGSQYNGSYGSGTSFAAPMVAGAAALLKARYPDQSAGALRAQLCAQATSLGAWAGFGLIDVHAALVTPFTPEIDIAQVLVMDDPDAEPGNDGDGRLDNGETVRLGLRLVNRGADVGALECSIATEDSDLRIGAANAEPIDLEHTIATGDDAGALVVFDNVVYSPIVSPNKTIALTLTLNSNGGIYHRTLFFNLQAEDNFTPPGIIATDAMWTPDRTYLIEETTVVVAGARLTIQPGVTVRFAPEGRLIVRGEIDAQGLESNPIRFTALDESPAAMSATSFTPNGLGVSAQPRVFVVGDVDNDGDNDVLTPNAYYYPNFPTHMSCLLWDNGAFQPETLRSVGYMNQFQTSNLNISDLDGDGVNEIIYDKKILHWAGETFLQIGTIDVEEFRAARDLHPDLTTPMWDKLTFVEDIDGDGDHDIVEKGLSADAVSVRLWNGSGFDPELRLPADPFGDAITVGDVDNDGHKDVLVVSSRLEYIAFYRWNGTGFDPQVRLHEGYEPLWVVVGDADRDGDNDMVVGHADDSAIFLYLWNGSQHEEAHRLGIGSERSNYNFIALADATNDGFVDIVASSLYSEDLILFERNATGAGLPRYGATLIQPETTFAEIAHCRFEYAPVRDQSGIAHFSDCTLWRTGGAVSLQCDETTSTQGAPLLRIEALENRGGGGILAPGRALSDCVALENWSDGLAGAALTRCRAERNGGDGMTGLSAEACTAIGNKGSGIVVHDNASQCLALGNGLWGVKSLEGDVSDSTASKNGIGLAGARISDCIARENRGVGIQVRKSAVRCAAERNGSAGITGSNLTDCDVVGNAKGLELTGLALRCTVAENGGSGIAGGIVESSVVHHNWGVGLAGPKILRDSWVIGNAFEGVTAPGSIERCAIERNGAAGVVGKPTEVYSIITDSSILYNAGSGIVASGRTVGCNISGNGGIDGYDYEENRKADSLLLRQVNLSGNYWGTSTTLLMNAHPWGSFFDIPRIYDFVDDRELLEARYENHLGKRNVLAMPNGSVPPFLLEATPGPDEAVGVGVTSFTLRFSKDMQVLDSAISVTFGREFPFTEHVVEPQNGSGWVDSRTWRGSFAIQSFTGDGANTLRVSAAVSTDGFAIPDDTAHRFTIDASLKPLQANNGIAVGQGSTRMQVSWLAPNDWPGTVMGYNVYRSASGVAGSFEKINSSLVVETEYADMGLEADTQYFYIVYIVDADMNATQYTPLFFGSTKPDANPDPPSALWILY